MSLTATTARFFFVTFHYVRKTNRPIRPKPLIATLVAIMPPSI